MAATHSRLHMIKPFGFSTNDRQLKRAGLDYWPFLDLEIHEHLDDLLMQKPWKFAFLAKTARKPYTDIPTDTDLLVFGRETKGLTSELWDRYSDHFYGIPLLNPNVRSLNLANSVSIVLYDQLQKRGIQHGVYQDESRV